jgi:hypothetical protein
MTKKIEQPNNQSAHPHQKRLVALTECFFVEPEFSKVEKMAVS